MMEGPVKSTAVGSIVGPGSVLMKLPESGELRVGQSLSAQEGHLVSARGGLLRQTNKGTMWIEGRQKRYMPVLDDTVVGIVADRHAENFVVNVGGPFSAQLPQLSFEGATRRNRPNLKAGDVVYAKVVAADRDMEPVLSCMDAQGRSAGLGPLKEGVLVQVSTAMARRLVATQPTCSILAALGAAFQFELATGANGLVWLNASTIQATVLISNVLAQAEFLTDTQAQTLVARVASQAG